MRTTKDWIVNFSLLLIKLSFSIWRDPFQWIHLTLKQFSSVRDQSGTCEKSESSFTTIPARLICLLFTLAILEKYLPSYLGKLSDITSVLISSRYQWRTVISTIFRFNIRFNFESSKFIQKEQNCDTCLLTYDFVTSKFL